MPCRETIRTYSSNIHNIQTEFERITDTAETDYVTITTPQHKESMCDGRLSPQPFQQFIQSETSLRVYLMEVFKDQEPATVDFNVGTCQQSKIW